MWLGERINENGIGNGISMILFANIISTLPSWIFDLIRGVVDEISTGVVAGVIMQIVRALVFMAAGIATLAFVVFFSNAERRIPVQYSKRMVGRKMYGGQNTYLPMKVNMSGVMPIIFASSMVSIPATIIGFVNASPEYGTFAYVISSLFSPSSPLYMAMQFGLIIAFSYFYISISFNPIEVSNNLKKNVGFIPGIRPGQPTTSYITKILNKIVLIGGLFLGVVAVAPLVVNAVAMLINQSWALGAIAFAGSSLLIVVGVALETTREIEAQMTMRHYKGFLE
jgi:preprotein translocase subunit SecY